MPTAPNPSDPVTEQEFDRALSMLVGLGLGPSLVRVAATLGIDGMSVEVKALDEMRRQDALR